MSPWTDSEAALLQDLLRRSLADAHGSQANRPQADAPQAVLCLCAEWCGVCREFRAAFEAAQADHPEWLFRWVDVEDDAEQLDELDIETFPTLVLGSATRTVFAGPVLPQAGALERHLRLLTA
ncbi:thioredoxin family protein [Comamonas serinivorans]|nr:thioredoxin family protein [Comamonas serinivorans]